VSRVTFVVSRSPGTTLDVQGSDAGVPAAEREAFETAVIGALAGSGAGEVLVVPHVYHLPYDHPAAARLRELTGEVVLCAWLYPRAGEWTLRTLGVDGVESLRAVNMDDHQWAESCTDEAVRASSATAGRPRPATEIAGPVAPRWYPVIDYSRCVGCKQCLEYCLFGVYSSQGERVVATSPDSCKPGCPACSRECPKGAIMFPEYRADAAIAGAPDADESARPAEGAASDGGRDELDDLIDTLENLDV
jgi:NAD-dependent dihydropyrimidine dehydrogenase PreA subunit